MNLSIQLPFIIFVTISSIFSACSVVHSPVQASTVKEDGTRRFSKINYHDRGRDLDRFDQIANFYFPLMYKRNPDFKGIEVDVSTKIILGNYIQYPALVVTVAPGKISAFKREMMKRGELLNYHDQEWWLVSEPNSTEADAFVIEFK